MSVENILRLVVFPDIPRPPVEAYKAYEVDFPLFAVPEEALEFGTL